MDNVLVIANVWPEPASSAAGWRMELLLKQLSESFVEVHFACTSNPSQFSIDLNHFGVISHQIELNSASFDQLLIKIDPKAVIFDRFNAEEQFGWRVQEKCPDALRVLNLEDLHCLRKSREEKYRKGKEWTVDDLKNSNDTFRELASIRRSDLSVAISSFEIDLLKNEFKIDDNKLFYWPFQQLSKKIIEPYENRNHFISIGNFNHPPNLEAVHTLKNHIWPIIRKELPKAELHLYGAYADQKVEQLNDEKNGFLIKGRAENAKEVVRKAKVLLAPLSFGAGLKGKLFEAMECGTPSVTTEIGIEGFCNKKEWGGFVENNWGEFALKAVELFTNEKVWYDSQAKGSKVLTNYFTQSNYLSILMEKIDFLSEKLSEHRKKSFEDKMLDFQSFRSSKFMSRWIELKNYKDLP